MDRLKIWVNWSVIFCQSVQVFRARCDLVLIFESDTFRSAGKVYLVFSIISEVLLFFSGKGHKFAKLWN